MFSGAARDTAAHLNVVGIKQARAYARRTNVSVKLLPSVYGRGDWHALFGLQNVSNRLFGLSKNCVNEILWMGTDSFLSKSKLILIAKN